MYGTWRTAEAPYRREADVDEQILGPVTPRRRGVLRMGELVLDRYLGRHASALASWSLELALADPRDCPRRGELVVIRATPRTRDMRNMHDPPAFPWELLSPLAAQLVENVRDITVVVPDVQPLALVTPDALESVA